MSDDDLIYPSDGSDDDVYDYGSDAEENEGTGSDSDDSSSSSGSDSSSGSASSDEEENLPLEIRLENLFYLAEDQFSERNYTEAFQDFTKIVALEVCQP